MPLRVEADFIQSEYLDGFIKEILKGCDSSSLHCHTMTLFNRLISILVTKAHEKNWNISSIDIGLPTDVIGAGHKSFTSPGLVDSM